jgi:3-oxoacyl-(acyl-carrier-protein) synthase
LSNKLNREYNLDLTPTLFFEYPTIALLTEHFLQAYREVFAARFTAPVAIVRAQSAAVGTSAKPVATAVSAVTATTAAMLPHGRRAGARPRMVASSNAVLAAPAATDEIAIVGISGRLPMAEDLDVFWRNLCEGRDCISEVPGQRWDWRAIYGDPGKEANKTNVKWGGFIDGIDQFDPLFFGISPREAEAMDPQQRLLMSYVWKAIEDAGYASQSLSGSDTALYIGTASSGYSTMFSQANQAREGYTSTATVPSIGPNRMSYFLNVHGPSEPVETACSSSLVAIAKGVTALQNGRCSMAIVGGINTILTPDAHISFSKAGMLSEGGRCKSFSRQADGYVRGEGVGMLVLKRLSDAERDGDHIYGLIKGTAENHGGRASSLTAPNPKAQAELLKSAYRKAGIDPRTVSYIEAHGTGTRLGDPVEITALKNAFRELYQDSGAEDAVDAHCGIGSVKSNIGHLELAAGVAGVIKVLLQLKHKTLVRSLHCEEINPYIDLSGSPFYIVQQAQPWEAQQDAQGRVLPRRAGVSSFGFGGVNAHVVLEEYLPPAVARQQEDNARPVVIVLSARTEERLRESAANLLAHLNQQTEEGEKSSHYLADLAYTLQVGRDAMEERLGMTVTSLEQLRDRLQAFVERQENIDDCYRGQVRRNKDALAVFAADDDAQTLLDAWIAKGKYAKLLELWVKGMVFDWMRLHAGKRVCRVSLPTYPFARDRYWLQAIAITPAPTATVATVATAVRHTSAPQDIASLPAWSPTWPGSDWVSVTVLNHVAELSGMVRDGLQPQTELYTLGLDSIRVLQLSGLLLKAFPMLDRVRDGDTLLRCTSIGALIACIEHVVAATQDSRLLPPAIPGATLSPLAPARLVLPDDDRRINASAASDRAEPDTLRHAQKRDRQNILCDELRLESAHPLQVTARVIVNEKHPFFFDHPLDHVSGLHLGAAMSEAVKVAHLYRRGLPADTAFFIAEVELDFLDICAKYDDILIRVTLDESVDADAAHSLYRAVVMQSARAMVRGAYVVQHLGAPEQSSRIAASLPDSVMPADCKDVNKLNVANVLLSRLHGVPASGEKSTAIPGCWLVPQSDSSFFTDFPGGVIDTLVLAEAARQCLRIFASTQPGNNPGENTAHRADNVDLLKTLKLQLTRPVFWSEAVYLELSLYDTLEIGSATRLQIDGRFLVAGQEVGRFLSTGLSLGAALHREWNQMGIERGAITAAISPVV